MSVEPQASAATPLHPNGYEVPLATSLSQPVLLGGVPRSIAVVCGTAAAVVTFGLHVWWLGLPVGLAGHALAVWATKQDPLWPDLLRRHVHLPRYLEA